MEDKKSILKKLTMGARAGATPGLVMGVLSFPVNYYLLAVRHRNEISNALGKSYTPSLQGLAISVTTAIILTICGVLYGLFYMKLPLKTPFRKALSIGLGIFILSRVEDLVVDYPVSHGLVFENALYSAPLLLFLYPYLVGRLYHRDAKD